jgi:tRNA(fMet)-specific endonuclease VapC
MVFMDTDHLSLMDEDTIAGFMLGKRLSVVPRDQVAVTIITYEEQMRGWLSYVAKANTPARQVDAYKKLREHVETFRTIPIIDYDEKAVAVFESLRQARVRIGTMDLKIAAIAIANDATLLTRNLIDFGKVPELRAEDWSV